MTTSEGTSAELDAVLPAASGAQPETWPVGRAYAWAVLLMLGLAFAISMIDRKFVSLVIEMIKSDMHLSDFWVGMLLGPSFATLYIVMGVPFGWLADRGDRRLIMGGGMAVWCLATSACGLATGVLGLFGARLLVGIGEASLSPSAMSLIGDYFPRRLRARAAAIYAAGAMVGGGAGYLIGGPLISWVSHRSPIGFHFFDQLNTWQAILVLLGLPGLVISGLLFFVHEPRRKNAAAAGLVRPSAASTSPASLVFAIRFMISEWRSYGGVIGGTACLYVIGYLSLWYPSVFERTWGWSVKQFGVAVGVMTISNALVGPMVAGWIIEWRAARGDTNGPLIALLISAAVVIPACGAFALMPTAPLAIAVLWVGYLAQAVALGAGPAAVLQISPDRIRGQVTAWYYLIGNVFGLLIGPPVVGAITDLLGGKSMLHFTIAAVSLVFGGLAFAMFWLARSTYRRATLGVAEPISPPV